MESLGQSAGFKGRKPFRISTGEPELFSGGRAFSTLI
jgi:hypothetical protein